MKYRRGVMVDFDVSSRPLERAVRAAFAALALLTSFGGVGCTPGLPSGIDYPADDTDLGSAVVTPEGDADPKLALSRFKFGPRTCEGVDTKIVSADLDQEDLTRFFSSRGLDVRPKKARGDLWWYEIKWKDEDDQPKTLRLRLAVLKDRFAAAKDLHDSLLQHGPGWWGVRRGNLALLAPKADLDTAVRFALRYKLSCWGMFTYAGVDDAYVVAGGYTEL